MIRKLLTFLIIIVVCVNNTFAQNLFSNTKYQLEAGTYLSTSGVTPFWLRSNQYGIVPLQPPILTFRGSAHKEYDSTKNENQKLRKFDYGYGFWGVANVGKQSGLLLPEAYLKVRYGAFEFYGGRRREIIGLVDTALTSGSYIWSANALPMPKLQISIPNYTSIIGHGLISIKGAYAHGWFDNQGDIKNYYLHQKWLYGRIGRDNAKFKIYAGFNHQVQWGGFKSSTQEYLANNWYGYLYSVLPLKNVAAKAAPSLTIGDLQNRVGNQLGSIDLGAELRKGKFMFFVYRQNLYEQGAALLRLANIRDGLNGLSITNTKHSKSSFIRKISFEFFYSKNQGTDPILFTKTVAWELENYFTHYQYLRGWTYQGKIIGTPLITTQETTSNVFPVTSSFVNNDRIKAFFIGTDIQINDNSSIILKNIYSQNNGLRAYPIARALSQFSSVITYNLKLHNQYYINASLAFDRGEIYPNTVGISFKTSKTF
jgi:Capsule assembly protein Wzi